MLYFFRRNLFINLIFLLLFIVLLFVKDWLTPAYYTIQPLDSPLTKLVYHLLKSPISQAALAVILVGWQSVMVNSLVTRHRLSRLMSYIPGAVYALMVLWITRFTLHPALLATTFTMMAFIYLFRLYKKYMPAGTLYKAGCFIGLATLVYSPFWVYIIAGLLSLFSLRRRSIFEFLQLFSGFLSPVIIFISLSFYHDALASAWKFLLVNPFWPSFHLNEPYWQYAPFAGFFLAYIFIFLNYSSLSKKKSIDASKKIGILNWSFLLALLSILLWSDFSVDSLLVAAIPCGFLYGLYFEKMTPPILANFIFTTLVILYFLIAFQAF